MPRALGHGRRTAPLRPPLPSTRSTRSAWSAHLNGTVVGSGVTRCIKGVTRNSSNALESVTNWDAFPSRQLATGDVVALRISARIGTNADDAFCGGHSNAGGLRMYYDASTRPSRFGVTMSTTGSLDEYLHSDGTSCGSSGSTGVTTRTTDSTAPTAAQSGAKCRDSGSLKFSGGNAWVLVDSWTLPALR